MLSSVPAVQVGSVRFGECQPPALMAGLCVLENLEHTLATARRLQAICREAGFGLVFKASYDKANRSSLGSYRGPGLEAGLDMLDAVREETGLPVMTDVHREEDVERVAAVVDCLQVPAFLCRQTDFVRAVAAAGKPVNVKKGQFMAPEDMRQVLDKMLDTGNRQITLTERGASFGYRNLVADFRSLPLMRALGFPVVFDATHSVQMPGGLGTASGGDRRFVPPLARAAAAVGVDGLFFETHPCPDEALCDGPNSMQLEEMPALLAQIRAITDSLADCPDPETDGA